MNTPRPPAHSSSTDSAESEFEPVRASSGGRKREAIYVAIAFVLGFLVLPALIYTVGILLLGPYAGGKSLWVFIGEFYNNLLHGTMRTWLIVLSPYLAFWVVRLSFRRTFFGGNPPAEATAEPAPGAQRESDGRRREPFISP